MKSTFASNRQISRVAIAPVALTMIIFSGGVASANFGIHVDLTANDDGRFTDFFS